MTHIAPWVKCLACLVTTMPWTAQAVPVTYSFAGELTQFDATLGGVTQSIESLSSREVFGFVSYDTERLEDPNSENFVLRSGLRGEGFDFEPNSARIPGSQAIYLDQEPDKATFFEFFEYDLFTEYDTKTMWIDLFGQGLIDAGAGLANTLDVSRFEHGEGRFSSDRYFPSTGTGEGFGGVFNITGLWAGEVEVPEPSTLTLLLGSLALLFLTPRRRVRAVRSIPTQRQ